MVAAQWLTAYDSASLRELAGLHGSEVLLIDELWPEVISELGVQRASDTEVWDLAASFLFEAWRSGDLPIMGVMSRVIRAYIENDYPRYPPEAAHLYGLKEELAGGWGRLSDEVMADAERTLTEWAQRRSFRS